MGFDVVDIALGALDDFLLGSEKGFKTVYAFEMVDTKLDEPIKAHSFVISPRVYRLTEPFATTLTPTENNTVIAEENGIIIRDLLIEGTFGLKEKQATALFGLAAGQDRGTDKIDGTQHFLALRNLFREYADLKKDPTRGPFIQMVFHSLKDDDHYLVIPKTFETPRDARTTRMHFEYRITMQAIAGPDFRPPIGAGEDSFGFFDAFKAIAGALQDTRAAFADATALISKIKRKVKNIDAILLQAAGVIDAVANFIRAGKELSINTSLRTLQTAALQIEGAANTLSDAADTDPELEEAARSLKRIYDAFDRMGMFPDKFGPEPVAVIQTLYAGEGAATETDLARNQAGASVGSRTRISFGTGGEAGLPLGTFRGVALYEVQRADSLPSLANKFAVPQELIILVNDLRPPYITQGGGPGIKKPGDQLLIPLSVASGAESINPGAGEDDYLSPEDALYGVDLALDLDVLSKTGKMEIKEDLLHGGLDADLSRGLNNVIQGITVILLQGVGESSNVPEVGIRRSIGVKGTFQHLMFTSINMRQAILGDRRVVGILSSSIVLEGDVLTQEITPLVVGGRNVTLDLPFGKARGDS